MREIIRAADGSDLLCQWEFPKTKENARYRGNSLVFISPSFCMRDIQGNGPAYSVKNSLLDLSKAFNESGRITFRFMSQREVTSADIKLAYSECLKHLPSHVDQIVYLGFSQSADDFAVNYYDYYRIHRPTAAVLISSAAKAIDLNNLTCPYFLIHGMEDPVFENLPLENFSEAVHHHQMRYGDATTHRIIPHASKEIGGNRLDPELIQEILYWFKTVPIDPDHSYWHFEKLA